MNSVSSVALKPAWHQVSGHRFEGEMHHLCCALLCCNSRTRPKEQARRHVLLCLATSVVVASIDSRRHMPSYAYL